MAKKEPLPENITREEAIESLERSGYLIENRIEDILINQAYIVDSNTYFPDPDTQKPREIDIIAYKYQILSDQMGMIVTCLLIECVNNPQPFALIPKEQHPLDKYSKTIHGVGIPSNIYQFIKKNGKSHAVGTNLFKLKQIQENHHYNNLRTATQFCSFIRKKNERKEWMATHEDSHYNDIKKICDATKYHIDQRLDYLSELPIPKIVNLSIFYPVLVLQGQLYDVKTKSDPITIEESPHLQLSRHSIINGEENIYTIDITTEDNFPQFLELLDKEIQNTVSLIESIPSQIKDSVDYIVDEINKSSSIDKKKYLLTLI
jgi:hypothetical protein